MAPELSIPQSRRVVLTAALGALTGLVASAIGRPLAAEAAVGDPLRLGKGATTNSAGTNNTGMKANSTGTAFQVTQNGSGNAFRGVATVSGSGGVVGENTGPAGSGAGVRAVGGRNNGVRATTDNIHRYAIRGTNTAASGVAIRADVATSGIGVYGFAPSGYGLLGSSTSQVGVQGQCSSGDGVRGISTGGSGVYGNTQTGKGVYGAASTSGIGVYGSSVSGFAGSFSGPVKVTSFLEMPDTSAPVAQDGAARLFARNNGGATELCVIFANGPVQVLATEPGA